MHVTLTEAGAYVEWLRQAVHELQLPPSTRTRAAAACFAIAQEHHHAIVRLIEEQLCASGFALLRVGLEAYVRGQWLSLLATDEEVERVARGAEPPGFSALARQLETTNAFSDGLLSSIKQQCWSSLCDYTHTGGRHLQRWQTTDSVESNYSREEVIEVLAFAEAIGFMAAIGIAGLAGNDQLALTILNAFKERTESSSATTRQPTWPQPLPPRI